MSRALSGSNSERSFDLALDTDIEDAVVLLPAAVVAVQRRRIWRREVISFQGFRRKMRNYIACVEVL